MLAYHINETDNTDGWHSESVYILCITFYLTCFTWVPLTTFNAGQGRDTDLDLLPYFLGL